MPLLLRVVLPALHLEDDDLVTLAVPNDFARHLGTGEQRNAGVDVRSIGPEEHLFERHRRADLGVERWDAKRLPRFGPELKTGGANDGVGHGGDANGQGNWYRLNNLRGAEPTVNRLTPLRLRLPQLPASCAPLPVADAGRPGSGGAP